MRKVIIAILVFIFINHLSFSLDVEGIVSKAFEKSEVYKNRKLVLKRSRISDVNIRSLKNKPSFSLGVENATYDFQNNLSFTPKLKFDTGDEEKFEISAQVPLEIDVEKSDLSNTFLFPSLSAEKTFNLAGTKNTTDVLALLRAQAVQESNELKLDLQFKKDIYKAILSCINSSITLRKTKFDFEKLSEEYIADLNLNNLTAESLTEKKREVELKSKELLYNKAKISYEKSLRDFKSLAGFDYLDFQLNDVEDIESISGLFDVDFEVKKEGNTDCLSKKYDFLIAKNRYDLIKNGDYNLKLAANAQYSQDMLQTRSKDFIASGKLTLQSPVFSLSVGGGGEWVDWGDFKPNVNLSFSLSPDKTIANNSFERQSSALSQQSAELDYQNALLDYYTQALEMQSELNEIKSKAESAQIDWDYAKENYKYNKELADLGFKSALEQEEDEITMLTQAGEYYTAIFDMLISTLDAKILNL